MEVWGLFVCFSEQFYHVAFKISGKLACVKEWRKEGVEYQSCSRVDFLVSCEVKP